MIIAAFSPCSPISKRGNGSPDPVSVAHRPDAVAPAVDTHRPHITEKLQLHTCPELVMFALAYGVIGPSIA